jgi:CRP/FNR family transcriptional regulator, dissimilatory nitrate respiration regulator
MVKGLGVAIDWEGIVHEQPMLKVIPQSLRNIAQLHPFAAGAMLFGRGDRPNAMLCVLSGEVRLVRRSLGGAEIILQRASIGFVAEASMESKAYHCDVIAAADGRLLRFAMPAFRAALEDDPAFRRAWIGHLASEVRKLRAQCERLSMNGAAERILHYVESEGTDGVVTLSQSRKSWAAELGLTHEVLYRTLRRLREDETLVIDGDRIGLAKPRG